MPTVKVIVMLLRTIFTVKLVVHMVWVWHRGNSTKFITENSLPPTGDR